MLHQSRHDLTRFPMSSQFLLEKRGFEEGRGGGDGDEERHKN